MKLSQILNDQKTNYNTKIEKVCKELPTELLIQWSIDCAESVLHIFEAAYPNDTRPRDALNAIKAGVRGNAAYCAANAAYCAAYAAANAANAANAAYAANAASESEKKQEELNIKLLLKQVEIYESPLYQSLIENVAINIK